MLTQEVRRKFLQYFRERGHSVIASSPVVPYDDPTLLFNNAGMNQFKDVFLGRSLRDYKRAATSQKCIRAGGKHNDLENVGHTSRHLTFFEMLGNFSFGDYFKEGAIQFAWEVSTQVFGFEPEHIWPTVFLDDDEAFKLWTKYVPAERITRFGEKENFWAMGDTGPCGPCSELLYDRGPEYGDAKNPTEDTSGERFLEFWNLVFMQYNRNAAGVMEPLPKPSIDTGAGLERILTLKMKVDSLFETDVLRGIITQVEKISGVRYDLSDQLRAPAFRVIADHLRCLSFAIADGVQPSNVDRGYVLRKVLRRAVRYGRMLGMDEPFLGKVLPSLIESMGPDYTELQKAQGRITEILTGEEEAFIRTLKRGGNILNQVIEQAQKHGKQISGQDAFKLKDTYGLPIEEIMLIAKDSELTVDLERYQQLEHEAKERSRSAQKSTQQIAGENLFADYVRNAGACEFLGYEQTSCEAHVTALVVNGTLVNQMQSGDEGLVVLNRTPFYAEMGGQIGDTGSIATHDLIFAVSNCQSPYKGVIAHSGKLEKGILSVGDPVTASIDTVRRNNIVRNHTATHLLHWALHKVLGEHAKQAGSVVDTNRLRFDFSHHKALTPQEIRQIEDLVNEKIRTNSAVRWYEIPYEEAQKRSDIKQFFGDKYGRIVRVVDIADFSKELCGGTHAQTLGEIGLFRIVKESSIAAGVRRIEAVTGADADVFSREGENNIDAIAAMLKVPSQKVVERIEKLVEENKQLQQEIKGFKKEQVNQLVAQLINRAEMINQKPVILAEVPLSVEELRLCADELSARFSSGIIVLASSMPDKCNVLVKVSDDLVHKGVHAQNIVKAIAPIIEGSGGGKANNAQAGGKAPQKLPQAFEAIRALL